MSSALRNAALLLLALLMGAGEVLSGPAAASPIAPPAAKVCKCCLAHSSQCVAAPCCHIRSSNAPPAVPTPLPARTGVDWQALAEDFSSPQFLSCFEQFERRPAALVFSGPGAVPIFQRDCSYLI